MDTEFYQFTLNDSLDKVYDAFIMKSKFVAVVMMDNSVLGIINNENLMEFLNLKEIKISKNKSPLKNRIKAFA